MSATTDPTSYATVVRARLARDVDATGAKILCDARRRPDLLLLLRDLAVRAYEAGLVDGFQQGVAAAAVAPDWPRDAPTTPPVVRRKPKRRAKAEEAREP